MPSQLASNRPVHVRGCRQESCGRARQAGTGHREVGHFLPAGAAAYCSQPAGVQPQERRAAIVGRQGIVEVSVRDDGRIAG